MINIVPQCAVVVFRCHFFMCNGYHMFIRKTTIKSRKVGELKCGCNTKKLHKSIWVFLPRAALKSRYINRYINESPLKPRHEF